MLLIGPNKKLLTIANTLYKESADTTQSTITVPPPTAPAIVPGIVSKNVVQSHSFISRFAYYFIYIVKYCYKIDVTDFNVIEILENSEKVDLAL